MRSPPEDGWQGRSTGTYDRELLLDGHDNLNSVERVKAEVAGEGRGRGDLEREGKVHGNKVSARVV